jgi:hypothetical protein
MNRRCEIMARTKVGIAVIEGYKEEFEVAIHVFFQSHKYPYIQESGALPVIGTGNSPTFLYWAIIGYEMGSGCSCECDG